MKKTKSYATTKSYPYTPKSSHGGTGPTGPTGIGNAWFLGSGCVTPTGAFREPILGDLLLNTDTCEICEYGTGGWTSTGKVLSCLNCEDVYDCLKDLSSPTTDIASDCTFTLTVLDCSPIFNAGDLSITRMVLAGQDQTVPVGIFSTPAELATLLGSSWDYVNLLNTHIYLNQSQVTGTTEGTESFLEFSNDLQIDLSVQCKRDQCLRCDEFNGKSNVLVKTEGEDCDLYWVDAACLGLTGNTGPTGFTGPTGVGATGPTGLMGPTGPTGPVSSEVLNDLLLELEVDTTNCQYCGLWDPSCATFLTNISSTYSVATALNSATNIVSGPITFSSEIEHLIALNSLNIVIVDNVLRVTSSPSLIDRVMYFNSMGQVIASFEVFATSCCPTGVSSQTEILTRISNTGVGWVSANCLLVPEINIEEELAGLPQSGKYKNTIEFNTASPFLNNNSMVFPLPWQITQMVLLGSDVTSDYSGSFNNFKELGAILEDNGWELVCEGSPIYRICIYTDTEPDDDTSTVKIIDWNNQVFFCQTLDVTSVNTEDDCNFQLVYVMPNNGSVLGNTNRIFTCIDTSDDINFTCTTCITTTGFIEALVTPGPWEITAITLGGQPQTPLPVQFSTEMQLASLLTGMGWSDLGDGLYQIVHILPAPSSDSKMTVLGSDGNTEVMCLKTCCVPTCGQTAQNRLFLAKDEAGNLSWTTPCCPSCGGGSGCGGGSCNACGVVSSARTCNNDLILDIPDSGVTPQYDLRIKLKNSLIECITNHFSDNGPFWIYSYKLKDGTQKVLEEQVDQPFSLKTLTNAFVQLGWIASPTVGEINSMTTEVTITLKNSLDYITGICINLVGNTGTTLPFNFLIPIDEVTDVDCPGLSPDANFLIKNNGSLAFVPLDCIVSPDKPALDLEQELCDLGTCDDELRLRACVRFDQCEIDKILDTFGTSNTLVITNYRLVGGGTREIEPDVVIGSNITIQDLINALKTLGWNSPDETLRPVEMNLITGDNINYVVINRQGANPILPPYPFLLGANCSVVIDCPSQDPANQTLIKKPDNSICWTQICDIPVGPTGPTGLRGFQGETGPQGLEGPQGATGGVAPIFIETGTGPTGSPTSGPVTVMVGDTVRFWSAGGVYTNVVEGSALVQVEPNNLDSDNGAPTNPPLDPWRPAFQVDTDTKQLYMWDPNVSAWTLQNGLTYPNTWASLTVDPTNTVFATSPSVDFQADFNGVMGFILIPQISQVAIASPAENFDLPFTLPSELRPTSMRSGVISFTTGVKDFGFTTVLVKTNGTVTIGSKNGYAAPWLGSVTLTIYSATITYHI